MNKLVLFVIVLQVLSLTVSAQKNSSVNNSSELVEKGNSIEKVAASIGLAPSSDPNGPYTGTEGSPVSFDGSKSSDPDGSIKSYFWDFGDGNTSISNKPKHVYIQNGVYTVSLKVTDNSGLSNTGTTVAIIEEKKIKADFMGTPRTGLEPLNVTFTDSSESYDGITSWKWDFNNDGKIDSTIKNPTYKFTAGKYTVALTVCETDGDCDTRKKTNYITASTTKQKKIVPSSAPNGPYTGTEGSPVSFDGSKSFDPDGIIKSYSWNFGDGNISNTKNPEHTYIQNGTYTVSLEVTDNDGLNATNTTTAIIARANNKPVSNFSAIPTSGLEPLNVTFTDSSGSYDGITSWKWDFDNDGKTDSTVQNPMHGYAAGTYTVALTVCETDGDCDTRTRTDYINATIKDTIKPVITITYPSNGQAFTTSSIRVSGTIDNTTEVSKVEVKVGNEFWVLAPVNTSWTVPSMNLSAGSNRITARATDNSSNIYETSVNVTYSLPDNTPVNTGGGSNAAWGGGGGGPSGENISNIELIEKYDLPISRNVTTFYRFTHAKNPVMFVNITGNTTMGIITASGEVLKGTSTLVKTPPDGLVYKNFNIWVGTSGFATPRNIKEAFIRFRVDNTWMSANNIAGSDLILMRWNGDSWVGLETRVLSKDDTNTFFEGKTYEFSPFAITTKETGMKSIDKENVPVPEILQQSAVKAPDNDKNSSQPAQAANTTTASSGKSTWSTILILLIINIIAVIMYYRWVKK
ncbi:MAG: PGF-pre-PGF domain-containing protein [Candidatus Methanoperedens sp.]|nr:PGF-pre-PGF domain-containing protein [Candidatus Methanoperedens sp.]